MKHTNHKTILKGVSTLDAMSKNIKAVLFLIILTALSANVFGGHSTLDIVDPNFNPQIQSNFYTSKKVHSLEILPDGKILIFGNFTTYNRVPVGNVVRLNPDGSLDPSFNNQTVTSTSYFAGDDDSLFVQPDGKIILVNQETVAGGQPPKSVVRLNSDGTLDTSFNYTSHSNVQSAAVDTLGRIYLVSMLSSGRVIVRLNADGSADNTFQYVPPGSNTSMQIRTQGSRLIVNGGFGSGIRKLYRLNENGSDDTSFVPAVPSGVISEIEIQPDKKILYLRDKVYRLNENGDADTGFQPILFTGNGSWDFKAAPDGKIFTTVGYGSRIFRRYLSNGVEDTTFTPYTHPAFSAYAFEAGGNLLIGDYANPSNATIGINNFIRLKTLDSTPDPAFNPGGLGFQTFLPGTIRSIAPQADGKILLGGKFDEINGVQRSKLARLNADSTVDQSFQINTSGTGNYFSRLDDIYQIRTQSDGKIIVSGAIYYVMNGEDKRNVVRLNSDGSIDPTFNLTYSVPDYSEINYAGRNRFEILSGNKLMIGTSKNHFTQLVGPIKLTESGSHDTTFASDYNNQAYIFYIEDLIIQPDGKIVISGSHRLDASAAFKSFIVRLNSDGSLDSTFAHSEENGRLRSLLAFLPNGKILVTKHSLDASVPGRVERFNPDGSIDGTFNPVSIPNGIINALLVLPNGKIFVGGKFSLTVNGQLAKNLLRLGVDGNLEPTVYNLNEEVLCLAADAQGRVLVGGGFTVIGANGAGAARSYVARLTDSTARFDFDGDGRADLGVFNNANGDWTIFGSYLNQAASTNFGLSNDKLAPADYDGDGKTDIAVFRPSNGVWYLLKSRDGFGAVQWGLAEDKPVAADFDGDGLADIAVWRPSSGVWYIRQSSNGQVVIMQFGLAGDIPLTGADFDGDGKTDIAVWRPSNGVFYWLASGSGNEFRAVQFGTDGDIPAPADYNGDGKTDLVVFRPAQGIWHQYLTQTNGGYIYTTFNFGLNGDEPIAADYDGDGKTDIAVRRGNVWHINRTGQGYLSAAFAGAEHKAVASAFNR